MTATPDPYAGEMCPDCHQRHAPWFDHPDFKRWSRPTAHNLSGMVPSMCAHGVPYLIVDPDDTMGNAIAGTTEDGRVAILPRAGASWVRGKYMTGNMTCVIEAGRPRPDDLAAAAVNRPKPGLHADGPVRMWAPEPYDPDQHGQLIPKEPIGAPRA